MLWTVALMFSLGVLLILASLARWFWRGSLLTKLLLAVSAYVMARFCIDRLPLMSTGTREHWLGLLLTAEVIVLVAAIVLQRIGRPSR
jgi:hypothetical protein